MAGEGTPNPAEVIPAPAPAGQQVVVTPAAPAAQGAPQEMFPRSYVEEIRASDAKHRVAAREAAARAEAAEKEVERLKPLEGEIKTMKVDAALTEVISAAGANAKLTRALIRDEIKALDPASDKLKESLTAIVDKVVKENPELKGKAAAPGTQSSGAPKAGSDITHPNTQTPVANEQWSREQLAAARKAGDHEGIAKALKEGKLKAILGGS